MNTRHPIDSLRTLLCTLAVAAATAGPATAQSWQAHDSIRAAAEQLAAARAGGDGRVVATADTLDPRLKLAACAAPLDVALPYASSGRSRITVEVSCSTPTSWRIFVPVLMQSFGPVVVAARPLPRDTILTAEDIRVEEREIHSLSRGHLAVPAQALGLKLRRALPADAPITPAVVSTPAAIKRGQTVTVKAASALISVAMTGTALEDGYVGQVIDVTNDSSGKRVQAIVRSARVVEVLLN